MTICVPSIHWWKAEKHMMRMKQSTIKSALWTVVHVLQRLLVTVEACLGWNDISIMSHSLSKLAYDKSKNIILDWIEDLSCPWTRIIGQDIPTQEWKLHLSHAYRSGVSVSNSLCCGCGVRLNDYVNPALAASLPWVTEPEFHILTEELNIT